MGLSPCKAPSSYSDYEQSLNERGFFPVEYDNVIHRDVKYVFTTELDI